MKEGSMENGNCSNEDMVNRLISGGLIYARVLEQYPGLEKDILNDEIRDNKYISFEIQPELLGEYHSARFVVSDEGFYIIALSKKYDPYNPIILDLELIKPDDVWEALQSKRKPFLLNPRLDVSPRLINGKGLYHNLKLDTYPVGQLSVYRNRPEDGRYVTIVPLAYASDEDRSVIEATIQEHLKTLSI